MTQITKLVDEMGYEIIMNSNEEKGDRSKISAFDEFNGGSIKSDSFVVDMERLPPLPDKDTTTNANSRITLQRMLSRKASLRNGEKKTNLNGGSERDPSIIATSPRGGVQGFCTADKGSVGALGATTTEHSMNPAVHNPITISTTGNVTPTTDNRWGAKRLSFRRSSNWTIDPRRILIFFATLSSIGTILLIYFTLSVGKLSTEESGLN